MTLQSKYQKDENRNKYAPIITLNVIRWPNGSNLKDAQSQVRRTEYGSIT